MALRFLASVAFFLAAPYWESKAPNQWTGPELLALLTDSPWAQSALAPGTASAPTPVPVFLATAGPLDQAEQEIQRRARLKRPPTAATEDDAMAEEYRAWLEENRATQLVLAIRVADTRAFSDQAELRRMEDGCAMRLGRKKIKMTGHFPPTPNDPYLRLAFPRQVQLSDKTLGFDLYLPGVAIPFRTVQFTLKDMLVQGKLEL